MAQTWAADSPKVFFQDASTQKSLRFDLFGGRVRLETVFKAFDEAQAVLVEVDNGIFTALEFQANGSGLTTDTFDAGRTYNVTVKYGNMSRPRAPYKLNDPSNIPFAKLTLEHEGKTVVANAGLDTGCGFELLVSARFVQSLQLVCLPDEDPRVARTIGGNLWLAVKCKPIRASINFFAAGTNRIVKENTSVLTPYFLTNEVPVSGSEGDPMDIKLTNFHAEDVLVGHPGMLSLQIELYCRENYVYPSVYFLTNVAARPTKPILKEYVDASGDGKIISGSDRMVRVPQFMRSQSAKSHEEIKQPGSNGKFKLSSLLRSLSDLDSGRRPRGLRKPACHHDASKLQTTKHTKGLYKLPGGSRPVVNSCSKPVETQHPDEVCREVVNRIQDLQKTTPFGRSGSMEIYYYVHQNGSVLQSVFESQASYIADTVGSQVRPDHLRPRHNVIHATQVFEGVAGGSFTITFARTALPLTRRNETGWICAVIVIALLLLLIQVMCTKGSYSCAWSDRI